MLFSACGKANCLLKTFLRILILMISLPVYPSGANLKLRISVTPKMVKKVIRNLDSSKASGPDCIPVVVLKNFTPEYSLILAKRFNIWGSLYLRTLGTGLQLKTTGLLVFFLWLLKPLIT